ncbi:UDP-N-acetylglucosamine:LPS N-acetylglucosamine transferase [Desulfitispora alkaliphila]
MKQLGLNIPLAVAITDYGYNEAWYVQGINMLLVTTKEQQSFAMIKGISRERIYISGVPIASEFKPAAPKDKPKIKKQLGLEEKLPVVLIMGGGLGLTMGPDQLQSIRNSTTPKQIVLITGNNKQLYSKLTLKYKDQKSIHIQGWVDNIHQYMQAADFLLTKPGGVTITEAMATETPIILMEALPGQEEENLDFLLKNRAALYYEQEKHGSMATFLDTVIADTKQLEDISKNASLLLSSHSPEDIARLLNTRMNLSATGFGGAYYGLS